MSQIWFGKHENYSIYQQWKTSKELDSGTIDSPITTQVNLIIIKIKNLIRPIYAFFSSTVLSIP